MRAVAGRTSIGPPEGLSERAAAQLLDEHGPNVLPSAERPTLARRLLGELREPMALLLVAAAGISGVLLDELVDAVAILAIVVVNAVIALVQEGRAARALEALEALDAPTATVVREGRRRRVAAASLVPGDLVVLSAGDRVPADLAVVDGSGLEVDEAVLTGESLPVAKHPGGASDPGLPLGDRDGMLHRGTLVTRGSGLGVAVATGTRTALGAIAQELQDIRRDPTPLQRQLAGLTRRLGGAAVLVAGATFVVTVTLVGSSADEAFLVAVALAVAAVPEGLAAVSTVALALGVGRMAQRGAIVRRLAAVETLGAVDVLVIDKTGTVTENRMVPSLVVAPDGTTLPPSDVPAGLAERMRPVLVLCSDATTDPPTGDPTERALLELVPAVDVDDLRRGLPRVDVAPFTSDRRRMSSLHELDDRPTLLVKGAPESVLPLCDRHATDRGVEPLTDEVRGRLEALVATRAGQGERLLALARRRLDGPRAETAGALEAEERDLELVGLVALRDPPRSSARTSVEAVEGAGIRLIMATGDHPATAGAIAREVGIDGGETLTGREVEASGLPADPSTVPVYARLDPSQKLTLVSRLQERAHTVAMTGDGVNDAPALRRADIGVALGATGSDVAREAADLVITDDDLATIVVAVREGRGIYDNLRKVVDYLVASNLAEVMVVIATLLVVPALGVPLFPLQLLWINLLTDGLPALALGVDPVDPSLMRHRPRPASARLLDLPHLRRLAGRAVVLAGGGLTALLVAYRVLDYDEATSRTVLFSTLVLAQVLYAFVGRGRGPRSAAPRNPWLLASVVGAVALHVGIVLAPAARTVFDTVALPVAGWVLVAVVGALAPALIAAGLHVLEPSPPSDTP